MKNRWIRRAVVIVLLSAGGLRADIVLNGNSTVTNGLPLNSTPVVTTNGVGSGTAANPWVYVFDASFSMGAYKLTTAGNPASVYLTQSFKLDLGGNDLSGNSGVTSLTTYGGWVANNPYNKTIAAGAISIVNAGNITIGAVDTHAASDGDTAGAANAGPITIGEPIGTGNGPVRSVSADSLSSTYLDVAHYKSTGNGAAITIYSTGSVTIAGNIATTTINGSAGDANIQHRGSFSAVDLLTWQNGHSWGGEHAGHLTCNGDYGGTGPTGTFQVRTLHAAHTDAYGGWGTRIASGNIAVSGYTNVRVTGNVWSYDSGSGFSGGNNYAGNITITNITGDIQIDGSINASAAGGTPTYGGTLTLIATGRVVLASLDLTLVKSAILSAGSGTNVLAGALKNFPITTPTASNLSATNGTVNGGTIYYNSLLAANLYLNGATYALGTGKGYLAPNPATTPGTSVNWTGATSTNFEDGANWTGGEVPTNDLATSDATIGTPGGINPALTRNRSVAGLNFTNVGWTLTGGTNTLTVGGDGIHSAGAGVNTVGARVSLDPLGGAWVVDSGNELQATNTISGSGPLGKDGAGTLTLTASNTMSDTTWVMNGTLNVSHGYGLGTSTLTVTNGTVNLLAETTTIARLDNNVTVAGGTVVLGRSDPGGNNGTLVVGDSRNGTFSPGITDASGKIGALTKVGTGTLTLKGLNTYSGSTIINAGTVAYGVNNALAVGPVTVNAGTLDMVTFTDTVGTVTLNGGTLNGASGILSSTGTFEIYSGTINTKLGGANVALNKTTTGTATFSGASTYTGTSTVFAGTVVIGNNLAFGSSALSLQGGTFWAAADYTLANACFLDGNVSFGYNGGSSYPGDLTFGQMLTLRGNYALTHNGSISDVRNVIFSAGIGDGNMGYDLTIKNGAYNNEAFTLNGSSTYSGATVLHGSTLSLGGSLTNTSEIRLNKGGTLQFFWNSSATDNRLANTIPVHLRGGRLSADGYEGNGENQWESIETNGTVSLDYGHSTIGAGGGRPRIRLVITNLVRQAGSTVYFYRAGNSSAANGAYGYGRVYLNGQPDGFIGGWAMARRSDYNPSGTLYESGYDFAYYSNSTAILSGVLPLETRMTRPDQVSGAGSADHVKPTAAQTTLSGNTSINSLCITNNGCDHNLGGFQLDIVSGGLLNSATRYAITNGTLTSSGGSLYLYNLGTAMTNGAAIVGGVSVSTVGNLLLSGNNTFSGKLYVNSGLLTLSGANSGVNEAIVAPGAFLILQNAGALSGATKVNLLYDGDEYARVTNSFANVSVRGLTLNGVKQAVGTYGATGSGCQYTNNLYFGGTGTLKVLPPGGTIIAFQ